MLWPCFYLVVLLAWQLLRVSFEISQISQLEFGILLHHPPSIYIHRLPGDTPHIDNNLHADEIIMAIRAA